MTLPKAPDAFDRVEPLEHTLALLPALRRRYGITRIADVTYLDRSAIPVVNAIVPDSPDLISVYNGKGPTRTHALLSAVMEAVERQAGANPALEPVQLRTGERHDALDARQLGLREPWWDRRIPFVAGFDLIEERPIYVPYAAVRCPWLEEPMFDNTSTNGLASGNTLFEAIYHALFELVERHVWSLAHARGHVRPRLIIEQLMGGASAGWAAKMVDDPVGKRVLIPTGLPRVDRLVDALVRAGLSLHLVAVEEGALPITLFATVVDPSGQPRAFHTGLGCSWSPEHAAIRAITEAVQGRLVDIQGAREDISCEHDPPSPFGHHGRRVSALPNGRWFFDSTAGEIALAALPDRSSRDLADELRRLVASLIADGVAHIAIVELTPADAPVAVVRAVVPELECATVDQRIGTALDAILAPYTDALAARQRRQLIREGGVT